VSPADLRLFDALPLPAALVVDQRITQINASLEELLRRPAAELKGELVWNVLREADRDWVQARAQARRAGQPVPQSYELDLIRGDGSLIRVEILPRRLSEHEVLVVVRDLSAQARDAALVVALSQLAERVQRARSVADALQTAGTGLQQLGISLHAVRVRGERLELAYVPGDALDQLLEQQLGRQMLGASAPLSAMPVARRALAERRSTYLDDFPSVTSAYFQGRGVELPAAVRALAGQGYGRAVLAPMLVEDRPWGLLLFASDRLTSGDAAALTLFTAQLATTVEVAEAFDRLQRSNRQLEAIYAVAEAGSEPELSRLIPAMLDIAATASGSEVASIFLVEDRELVVAGCHGEPCARVAARYPRLPLDASSPAAVAASTGRPRSLAVRDWPAPGGPALVEEGVREVAVLPLQLQGRLAGVLLLGRTRPQPYGAEELHAGEQLAGQVAIQLEKARLLADARRRVRELDLLLEMGRVITESLDPERIGEAAAVSLARIVDCDQAFVWLFDPRSAMLRGAYAADPAHRAHFQAVRLPLQSPTAAARAMVTRAPVRVEEARGSPVVNQDLLDVYKVHSLLALPLMLRDEAIGSVTVGDTRRRRSWTDAEVERATVIARQLAVAVANARLFEDLKRSYDDLARTQAELVKRERLAALGELAAVVAHEVRNPLGVIFNSVSSLKRLDPGGEAPMLLEMVGEEADRLNRIVGDLLDFARPHEPALRPEAVPALLQSVREAALAATSAAVQIALEVPGDLPRVPLDARMLRQALLNLVVNAIQAMPRGGAVTLRAGRGLRGGRPHLRLEVSDTGPGIPAGTAERMFQPFFTTKATGTGLGLAVVKRIVEDHRGEVTVDSREGQGSTFTLWLPEEAA
jgi:PAS domain S-box-containing protein